MGAATGDNVKVHYRGTLADGTEFDSSAGREPLCFEVGAGQVIPGFDRAVLGLEPGQSVTVTIESDDAYGPRHEEAVQAVPAEAFHELPDEGATVDIIAPDGQPLRAVITSVTNEEVVLDFNHPLAGETLTFEIELVEVVAG